jgi:hypothetical protein
LLYSLKLAQLLGIVDLIKHILGLKYSSYREFTLLYLWYNVDSNESKQHAEDLARFSAKIKDEINSQVMTYPNL